MSYDGGTKAPRAQLDEGSRVAGDGRQWIQLLEALEGLCNRGLNKGVCIQRVEICMLHAVCPQKRGYLRARGPLYIEEMLQPGRNLARAAPPCTL